MIGRNPDALQSLRLQLIGKGHHVIQVGRAAELLGLIYSDPVDLVIADLATPEPNLVTVISDLKADSFVSTIPLLGILPESSTESSPGPSAEPSVETFDWEACPVDDFIRQPIHYPEFFGRLALALQRTLRVTDRNPLTKLPGNTSIQLAIQRVLQQPMAVGFLDLNQFKPYNDAYGFARGDEVLRMVGRIVANTVREVGGDGFVGHIGGDDFVFIVAKERARDVCEALLQNFNMVTEGLFGEEERAAGYFIARNRKGEEQQIPLLGVAIAVVFTDSDGVDHTGRVAELAAELKRFAKMVPESRYVFNLRGQKSLESPEVSPSLHSKRPPKL